MRTYIAVVKGQVVTFDPKAEVMLKKYYTATQAIRKCEYVLRFSGGQ